MTTDVQREAIAILEGIQETKNEFKGLCEVFAKVSKPIDHFAPLVGTSSSLIFRGIGLLMSRIEDSYESELKKVIRGERSTLPEPPPKDDNSWCGAS